MRRNKRRQWNKSLCVCACCFFFAISFSHSSGFFPFFLLFLTLQLKKTTTKHNHIQQTDSSNALLLLSETKKKPTHTSSQTHTYIDTETHTHLPQSRARRYFSNWTYSIFKKEKRGENVSAPLRITSRGLRCVRRRAALVKCSAHTLTLTHTHTHTQSAPIENVNVGWVGRGGMTSRPGSSSSFMWGVGDSSSSGRGVWTGRARTHGHARTQMTSTRFIYFFLNKFVITSWKKLKSVLWKDSFFCDETFSVVFENSLHEPAVDTLYIYFIS